MLLSITAGHCGFAVCCVCRLCDYSGMTVCKPWGHHILLRIRLVLMFSPVCWQLTYPIERVVLSDVTSTILQTCIPERCSVVYCILDQVVEYLVHWLITRACHVLLLVLLLITNVWCGGSKHGGLKEGVARFLVLAICGYFLLQWCECRGLANRSVFLVKYILVGSRVPPVFLHSSKGNIWLAPRAKPWRYL